MRDLGVQARCRPSELARFGGAVRWVGLHSLVEFVRWTEILEAWGVDFKAFS